MVTVNSRFGTENPRKTNKLNEQHFVSNLRRIDFRIEIIIDFDLSNRFECRVSEWKKMAIIRIDVDDFMNAGELFSWNLCWKCVKNKLINSRKKKTRVNHISENKRQIGKSSNRQTANRQYANKNNRQIEHVRTKCKQNKIK